MIQNIIVYLILASVTYYIFLSVKNLVLKKNSSKCDGCSGCAAKELVDKSNSKKSISACQM